MKFIRAALSFLWLDSITIGCGVATTVLLLSLWVIASVSPVGALLMAGLISTQVCLATAWATWSQDWSGRLFWRLGLLYLLLLFLESFREQRHTMMLWALPLTMGCFVLATWLPSAILRWFRWRRVRAGDPPPAPRRLQFGLADVLRWSTLLCLLLAVMTRFRNEVEGWDNLGYAIMIFFGVLTAAPTGPAVSVLLWLCLGECWTTARGTVAGLLGGIWGMLSLLAACYAFGLHDDNRELWQGIWVLASVVCLVTLVTAGLLRAMGWRVMRIPPQMPNPDRSL